MSNKKPHYYLVYETWVWATSMPEAIKIYNEMYAKIP